MNELLQRRDAALKSLSEHLAAERLRDQARLEREDSMRARRRNVKSKVSAPSNSSEYMKLYMRQYRKTHKRTS